MQPSSPSSRGGSRVGSVKYAHSPYVYRTTVEEAPVSPMSDHGRQDSTGAPQYHSPRSLSQSTGNGESSNLLNGGGSQADFMSQPNSPLGRSGTGGQEYSQPIQVGSAPNVHPRYRRGMQSPMTRPTADSGSRGGFPSSPAGSLPPRSPFMARDDGSSGSAFAGGESAPVRGSNNPYRMNAGTGLSAPQYAMPLSGSYRGGSNSGSQSPSPHLGHQHNTHHGGNGNNGNNNLPSSSGAAAPPYLPPPTSPPSMAGAAPAYSSSNTATNTTTSNANNNNNTSSNSNTYAPTGFSMPPTMASANPGSYHGTPSGRGNSQSGSYVDPRSSHPSSPLLAGSSRPAMSGGNYMREPISPNHAYHSGGGSYNANMSPDGLAYSPNSNSAKNSNGAPPPPPPPAFATAVSQQQQSSGAFGVGSFPGRRAPGPSGAHPSSPYSSHMNMNVSGTDPSMMSESYGTNTKTLSTLADDTVSSSGKSGSSASSIRDDLPLCPNDDACTMINDRKHQKKYAHTCRLFPCYHGHVTRHAKLFRHAPGQISLPEGLSANAKVSSHALASVNFSTISPEAPNAYRIYVSHGDKSYEIFGDWASVKVHTFKRYLHQVYHIPPGSQVLSVLKTGKVMDDDINSVKCYGIEEDSVIELRSDTEDGPASGKLRIPLDDL